MSDYKRLTKQAGWHKDIDLKDELGYSYIYQRLAELENKIEQGTLIELPCKVGDTVYWVWEELTNGKQKLSIHEWQVDTIQLKKDEWAVRGVGKERQDGSREFFWCHSSRFGIWWFLTREEAEKKL